MENPSFLFFAQYLLPLCRQADGVLLLVVVAQQRPLRLQLAAQNHLGGGVLDQLLHRTTQRTRPVAGAVAFGAQLAAGGLGAAKAHIQRADPLGELGEQVLADAVQLLLTQLVEQNRLIDAV